MNLLDFISSNELNVSLKNDRISFVSFGENKIVFKFLVDVFEEIWVQHAIAGKYDEQNRSFKIVIGINEKIQFSNSVQNAAFNAKISKEFKPFKSDIEKYLKLYIIEYLLSNPEYSKTSSFTLHNEIIKL